MSLMFYMVVGLAAAVLFLVVVLWFLLKLDQFLTKRKNSSDKKGIGAGDKT